MNEQLQQAISQLITMSLVAIDKGATFLSGQIPDVIQQLLLWKAWESFLHFFIFGIVLSIVIVYANIKQFNYWMQETTNSYGHKQRRIHEDYGALVMFNILQFLWVFILPQAIYNLTWFQIWLAPKVYLIEYAKEFLK